MNGFINCNKPAGLTSSDVVSRIKRISGGEKVGHMGTLDPGAAGVLPIAIGKATRLFDFLTRKKKKYRACFTFGVTTDTLDSYGAVTGKGSVPSVEGLERELGNFIGRIKQIPPAYSAISIGGVRAYRLARDNKPVVIEPREVEVFSFDLIKQSSPNSFVFDIICGGGTYIRSLVRDLAESCGTVGYMSYLIRLQSGVFNIEEAFTLDRIQSDFQASVLPVEYVLGGLKRFDVPKNRIKYVKNGIMLPVGEAFEEQPFTVYAEEELLGLGERKDGMLEFICRLDG